MTKNNVVFFDSHGTCWVTCDGAAEGAVAFGPTGIARPVTEAELKKLGLNGEGTSSLIAHIQGRVAWPCERGDGPEVWPVLVSAGVMARAGQKAAQAYDACDDLNGREQAYDRAFDTVIGVGTQVEASKLS